MDFESSEEIIDTQYIIENKPSVNIVRDFMRTNICSIKSDDDLYFEKIDDD